MGQESSNMPSVMEVGKLIDFLIFFYRYNNPIGYYFHLTRNPNYIILVLLNPMKVNVLT